MKDFEAVKLGHNIKPEEILKYNQILTFLPLALIFNIIPGWIYLELER